MKRVTLITITLFVFFSALFSQNEIEKIFDYSQRDYVKDILKTEDGGYLILGNIKINGQWGSVLIKTDQKGNLILDKFYEENVFYDMEKYAGSFYLAGSKHLYLGYYQSLLTKVNSNGDTLWSKMFEYDISSYLSKIKHLSSGDLVLMQNYGYFWPGNHRLIKTDSSGNVIWNRGTDGHSDILQINENEIAVSGSFYQDLPEPEFDDVMWPLLSIFNVDDGSLTFHKEYLYMNWAENTFLSFDGNYFFMLTDNNKYAISKLDTDDTIWTRKYPEDYIMNSICISEDNLLFIPGAYQSNLMIYTMSSEGDSVSMYLKDEFPVNSGVKIMIDNDSIVLVGNAGNENPVNINIIFLKIPVDILITGTNSIQDKKNHTFSVFPNPFNNWLNIKLPDISGDQLYLRIYSMKGTILYNGKIISDKGISSFQFSYFEPGIYFVSLYSNDKLIDTRKVIKK